MYEHWDEVLQFFRDTVTSAKDRRSIINNFVPDMVEEGINQTQALNIFQRQGFGIRSSDFGEIYRGYSSISNVLTDIASIPDDEVIPESLMKRSENLNDPRYRYVFNTGYVNKETGRFFLGNFSFATDELMTKASIEAEVEAKLREAYGDLFDDIAGVKLIRSYINTKPFI